MSIEDYHQDVARSSYADMLFDDERNKAYDHAIKISVNALVNSQRHNPSKFKFFRCCDIGTGSGLLSMMIVRAFKSHNYTNFHVYSFEEFLPMADCAKRVIQCNEMSDKITVIPERSDRIDLDKAEFDGPFDLLVAELLDTELIGEGCLGAYRHAVEKLCSPTCLFVPHQARIYIEPVASSFLFRRHAIEDLSNSDLSNRRVHIKIPDKIRDCSGLATIDDMQASALSVDQDIIRISEPQVVFHFIFNKSVTLQPHGYAELKFPINKTVDQPVVIIMWWDIIMYDKLLTGHARDEIRPDDQFLEPDILRSNFYTLSCAPVWARDQDFLKRDKEIFSAYQREVWREHWIQGVYYFSDTKATRKLIGLEKGDQLPVFAYHDDHSMRFELAQIKGDLKISSLNCTCGVHRILSRSQLASLSDENSDLMKLIKASITPQNYYNDLITGQLGVTRQNGQSNVTINIAGKDLEFLYIFGDIPWEKMFTARPRWFGDKPIDDFVIKCTQVEFDNLYRICAPIHLCEGFNLQHLDSMISTSSKAIDQDLESHYLWEYKSKRLDHDHIILSKSMLSDDRVIKQLFEGEYCRELQLPIKTGIHTGDWKKGWALVFWVEFTLKHTGEIISTGPTKGCDLGEYIEWTRYYRQPVYFLHRHPDAGQKVKVDIKMDHSVMRVDVF